jgi:hypothetical protein
MNADKADKVTVRYGVDGESPKMCGYTTTIPKAWTTPDDDFTKKWIAESVADDYHTNHDGWDSPWPVTFEIEYADGAPVGTYEVNREAIPEFHARLKGDNE